MHARYYSPAIGHFLIPDTVLPNPGDSLSYDRHAYVRNNPIAFTDPNGHHPIVVGLITGALIGGAVADGLSVRPSLTHSAGVPRIRASRRPDGDQSGGKSEHPPQR